MLASRCSAASYGERMSTSSLKLSDKATYRLHLLLPKQPQFVVDLRWSGPPFKDERHLPLLGFGHAMIVAFGRWLILV